MTARSRLVANAVLNVLSGVSGALFAFVVPVMMAGRVTATDLSTWTLVMQAAVYVVPFSLGIQGVLARHVALHAERADPAGLRRTMDSAFRVLSAGAVLYVVLGVIAGLFLGDLYPAIPGDRLADARTALVVFVLGQATSIPASAVAGYFFGIQRNLPVTASVLGIKTLSSIAIIGLAGHVNLTGLAMAASLIAVAGNGWLLLDYRASMRRRFGPVAAARPASRADIVTMLRECGPISLWTLATFLIYGGTSTVASTTDFANFPAYAMAVAATLLMMGVHSAVMSPLIPHIAVVRERGGAAAVGDTLNRASQVSAAISAIVMVAYAAIGPWAVRAVIPAEISAVTIELLPFLLCGNAIRLLGLPYANSLVGLGLQGKILWTPILEAGATFGSALWLGPRFGLAGVAASIAVGGVVSILIHLFINMPLTREQVPVRRSQLSLASLLILGPAAIVLFVVTVDGPMITW